MGIAVDMRIFAGGVLGRDGGRRSDRGGSRRAGKTDKDWNERPINGFVDRDGTADKEQCAQANTENVMKQATTRYP